MSKPVTVIISTFNSSGFIYETLQSVYNQTWKEIELIITDDCSSDNTINLSEEWINLNRNRFHSCHILTSVRNTGVSGNANRGLMAAKAEWIKFLGADDTLKPNCIEDNMKWISQHQDIQVLFSGVDLYKNIFKEENLIKRIMGNLSNPGFILSSNHTADIQYKMLLLSDRIHFSPSLFIRRQTLLSIGGFDERFRFLEDYPLWLNLTRKGVKMFFMEISTVNYRQHSLALNNTEKRNIVNPNYFKQEKFRKLYVYPNLPWDIRFDRRYVWYAQQIFRIRLFGKNSAFNKFLHLLLTVYLNPFKYFLSLKKHILSDAKLGVFYKY